MISADMVYRILGRRIVPMWFKFETIIKWNREGEDGPGRFYFEEFEYLAEEMIKISLRKGERLPLHHLHPESELINKYT